MNTFINTPHISKYPMRTPSKSCHQIKRQYKPIIKSNNYTQEHITYPALSRADPRRLFLRWLAVTANGAAGLNPPPTASCNMPTQTECDRLSWKRLVGVPVGVPVASVPNTEDVSDPDSRDSRRNRPITDLAALGFVNPPTLSHKCIIVIHPLVSSWCAFQGDWIDF